MERQLLIIPKLLLVLVILLAVVLTIMVGDNGIAAGSLSILAGIVCEWVYLSHRRGDREDRQMATAIGVVGLVLVLLGPLSMIFI